MHVGQHLLVGVGTGDLQHLGMHGADLIFLGAQAAGDDHLAIFGQGFTNGFERFLYGAVDEAAGVDDHQLGIVVAIDHLIPFGAQLGQDPLGIHQIFRTAQGDEADARRTGLALGRRGRLGIEHLSQRIGGTGTGGIRIEGLDGHRQSCE